MSAPSAAGQAWARLLASLAEAGAVVEGPLGATSKRERAEGYRHITRVLSIAAEMLLEKGDPARPAFTRWMNPHRKMFGDNPHTIYDAAVIDPGYRYVVRGTRGTAAYLGICVYGTAPDGARRIVANLDDTDMQIAEDGTFTVELASRQQGDGAFLALEPDATDVMVRQYFVDRDAEEPASYTIEAQPPAGPPPALAEDALAERLDVVGAYVRDTVETEATLSALITSVTPTQLRGGSEFVDDHGNPTEPPVDPAVVARVMPSPAIQYAGSWFSNLGDDEAIVVTGTVPACRYWSIQLLTRWMESGDYQHHPVFLSDRDIAAEADGTFRVVIAGSDPGTGNWIDTTGMPHASIAVRALLAEGPLDITFHRQPHHPGGG